MRDRTGLAVSCLKTSDIHRTHMPVSSSQKLRSLRGSDKFVDPLYKPIHPQWSPMVSMHCQCEGPVAAVLAHGSKSFLSHQDHAHGSYARRGQSNHQILHLSSQTHRSYRSVMKCLSFQVHFLKIQSTNWGHFGPDVRQNQIWFGCHLQHDR